jgi:hypothetical protein
LWAWHGTAAPRASSASCRQAANGLISLLDAGKDNSSLYRGTYNVVVNTCGPVAPALQPPAPPPDRSVCRDLAAAMVNIIEDEKMDSAEFATARDRFAVACAPR